MATYTAVVSLMHDLEQHLTSCDHIFSFSEERGCPFKKHEVENLYSAVSLMNSFLRNSSGQSYNCEFINQILEEKIRDVARRAGNYVDFWAVQCLPDKNVRKILMDSRLSEIIEHMNFINRIAHNSTGKFFRRTAKTVGKFVGLEITMSDSQRKKDHSATYNAKDHSATYNALDSLMKDLEPLAYRSLYKDIVGSEDITSLYETIRTMSNFLKYSSGESGYMDNYVALELKYRIPKMVSDARNLLEPALNILETVLDLPHTRFTRTISEYSIMTRITEDIVSINEELKKIRDNSKVQDLEITSSTGKFFTFLSSPRRIPNTEVKLVGLEEDLVIMLDNLTRHPSQLKVLSIIGMAGIGKTTFARKLYDNPLVLHHFYVRVWVTVSQQYHVRELLLGVLSCITIISDEIYERSDEEIRERVYRILKGKRYLIVLDDMWDANAWDELKRTFPDDKNGSRIMLTSRLRDVAVHASQDTPLHSLRCLSIHESWELLSSKIFMDEPYPLELAEIGELIAYRCRGLPLALVVVGGILSKLNKKLEVWQEVAQSLGSVVMDEAEHCQDILALSYNHLPDHLKVCFLYMGIFPEDYEISVKKLIWLWIAEEFIRPSTLKSLEEVAEDYLDDLISRSLILEKKRSSDGRIKTCYIHDLIRELCLRECQKQNFLHVINNCGQLPPKPLQDDLLRTYGIIQVPLSLHNLRRLSFHSSIRTYFHETTLPCTRSILCFEKLSLSDRRSYLGMDFKLLKVLNIMNIRLRQIPEDISNLTLLKFVAVTIEESFDMMYLSKFLSLQTLILDCEWNGHLPEMLWDMLQLRHFHLKRSCLSCSPLDLVEIGANLATRVLNNLRSVSTIRPISCTKKIFLSMPHLKKLGIYETEEDYGFRGWFKRLVHLRELETLKYVFSNPFVSSDFKPERVPSWDSFPPKLVKLTLSGTSLPWDDMLMLSMLPKLEVLKLRNYAFSGEIWESAEGGFCHLKFLLIGSTNLEIWEADGNHFPKLQHLVLRHCRSLREIPYGIGEAPLLETIELHHCTDSAALSARHLQKEQQSLGNDSLTICITEG